MYWGGGLTGRAGVCKELRLLSRTRDFAFLMVTDEALSVTELSGREAVFPYVTAGEVETPGGLEQQIA